jgi:NADPH:quinone reductase-like Zn-dependent oxidoreductase
VVQQPGPWRTPGRLRGVRGRGGRALLHLPAAADPVAAAALAHPAATAWLALFRHGDLRPAETAAVGGGAGNVGAALTRLASLSGARVLATARPADADWCRAAGAAEVVDYRDPDLAGRLLAAGAPPVRTHGVWPLERVADAHRAVAAGVRGRIVLRVADPAPPG